MDITVDTLLKAGLEPDDLVDASSADNPTDTWPMGLKRPRTTHGAVPVVLAKSAATVSLLLSWATVNGIRVQVQGGRSNVVGSLDGTPEVVLRLTEMDRIVGLDDISQVVTVEAGVIGTVLEGFLNSQGFTLGHYPQSLPESTVGGWIATRATGAASARFGGIERIVCGLEGVLAGGEMFRVPVRPRAAGGLDAVGLMCGAEGSLAVITTASLAVSRIMPETRVNGLVPSFAVGLELQRELIQRTLPLGVVRLLNPTETEAVLQGEPNPNGSCLVIMSILGEAGVTEISQGIFDGALSTAGGTAVDSAAADRWWDHRFAPPGLIQERNSLPGSLFDTIEVSAPWRSAPGLADALEEEIGALVDRLWLHSSHVYPTGTCLYLAYWIESSDDVEALRRGRTVWDRTLDLVEEHDGSIGHHHGIGAARSGRYVESAEGRLHRSVKQALDPQGVLSARLLEG